MNNIIIGKRSILSKSLKKNLPKAKIITTEEFLNLKLDIKSNLIINTFYPSYRLNSISKYSDFIDLGLKNLCIGLDRINKKKINKIIYTSSASIYGLKKEIENSIINNRNIYSTSKLLAENIIKNYCYKNKINFTIARVFNLYGDNGGFDYRHCYLESTWCDVRGKTLPESGPYSYFTRQLRYQFSGARSGIHLAYIDCLTSLRFQWVNCN